MVTFGRYLTTSSKLVMLNSVNCTPVRACMVIGTSCKFCERRCAVTVTSSSAPDVSVSVAVAARDMPAHEPKIAAIATASFWLFCKRVSQGLRGRRAADRVRQAQVRRPRYKTKEIPHGLDEAGIPFVLFFAVTHFLHTARDKMITA